VHNLSTLGTTKVILGTTGGQRKFLRNWLQNLFQTPCAPLPGAVEIASSEATRIGSKETSDSKSSQEPGSSFRVTEADGQEIRGTRNGHWSRRQSGRVTPVEQSGGSVVRQAGPLHLIHEGALSYLLTQFQMIFLDNPKTFLWRFPECLAGCLSGCSCAQVSGLTSLAM